jgi:phospholipase C
MRLNNVSFALYMNNTGEKNWPAEYLTPVDMPDVILQGVARYRDSFRNHTDFYERAAAGTLPSVSWVHPPSSMCDHPCHDLALGERLHKDIYEALRAGPKWEKTALAIIYDDDGDFYVRRSQRHVPASSRIFTRLHRCLLRTQDHVVSPFEGVPADGAGCHVAGSKCEEHFDFRRLGPRGSALLISPWVEKGAVFQVQKNTHATSTCVSDWISHFAVVLELLCVTRSSGRF